MVRFPWTKKIAKVVCERFFRKWAAVCGSDETGLPISCSLAELSKTSRTSGKTARRKLSWGPTYSFVAVSLSSTTSFRLDPLIQCFRSVTHLPTVQLKNSMQKNNFTVLLQKNLNIKWNLVLTYRNWEMSFDNFYIWL